MGHSTTKWTKIQHNKNINYVIKCNLFLFSQYAKVLGSENQISIEISAKKIPHEQWTHIILLNKKPHMKSINTFITFYVIILHFML